MSRPLRARVLVAVIAWTLLSASLEFRLCAETNSAVEPVFKSHPAILEALACTITKASFTATGGYIEFTGHWNHSRDFLLPDYERNGVSFNVDQKSDPAVVETMRRDAQKLVGKKASIIIHLKHGLVSSRGGIFIIFVPADTDDIKIIAAP